MTGIYKITNPEGKFYIGVRKYKKAYRVSKRKNNRLKQ